MGKKRDSRRELIYMAIDFLDHFGKGEAMDPRAATVIAKALRWTMIAGKKK
jgi:hypothetical protein